MKKTLHTICVFCTVLCGTYSYAEAPQSNKIKISESATSTASSDNSSAAYGVSIGTVDAQLYSESGLNLDNFYLAEYVAQPDEGTYMGFIINSEYANLMGEGVSFVAISSTKTTVTIPDSIRIGETTYPVCNIYDQGVLSASFSTNIKSLTIPSTVKSILNYNKFDYNLEAVYMLGDVPDRYNIGSNTYPKIYVCDSRYFANYMNNNYFKDCLCLPFGWDFKYITVKVEKEGEFADNYLTNNEHDWGAAQYVKVIGNINDIDLTAIKNLTSLMKLDLSETTIKSLPEKFMLRRTSLIEVKLPATLDSIASRAFYGCTALQSVELNGISVIGPYAFHNCSSLPHISLAGAKIIYQYAFDSCSALNNIDLSSVVYIGSKAFNGCSSLQSVNLSSAISIGSIPKNIEYNSRSLSDGGTFGYCTSLKHITFGNSLKDIESYAFCNIPIEEISLPEGLTVLPSGIFADCDKLVSLTLPSSLTTIGAQAFNGCTSLQEVTIPSSVASIGASAFNNTGIKSFKCYAAVPPTAKSSFIGEGMDMSRIFLYVPPFSKDFYRNTQYWSDFFLMRSIDKPIDYIFIDRPLTINLEEEDNAAVANNPTIILQNDAQLSAKGAGTLSAGQTTINGTLASRRYNSRQSCPTLINYADKMRADNVSHNLTFYNYTGSGEWHFISLPYDVKVSDIVPTDNTYWVIRRYDSAARAAGEATATWVNLTGNDVMEAGKGYIVSATGGESYTDESGNTRTAYPRLSFTSGNSLTKNNLFRSTDVIVPLTEYQAEFAHNRSWNFIGNPYPCYFDMHYLNEEFTAPVTIWNGSSYVAYSPVDDDLVLAPYESFFVQCPLDATEMTFREAGRMHSDEGKTLYKSPAKNHVITSLEERNIFNFEISNGSSSDRARIVLNPEASLNYEVGRDASKFFAGNSNNAQIYVAADVNYSISERPYADGMATLGVRFSGEDVYTLSLSGNYNHGWSVIVTDNLTATSVDLTKDDYKFTPVYGDSDNRFSVKFENGEISGIESVISDFGENAVVTVSAINGMTVYSGRMSAINVPTVGLYIISNGKESRKAILK